VSQFEQSDRAIAPAPQGGDLASGDDGAKSPANGQAGDLAIRRMLKSGGGAAPGGDVGGGKTKPPAPGTDGDPPDVSGPVKLIETPNPNGHPDWVAAINKAKASLFMEMFHLDDPAVIDALIAAKSRGVDVKVILDRQGIETTPKFSTPFQKLKSAGVAVRESSEGFAIQHVKAMVIDGKISFVTSMNMTETAATTRDFGLILEDPKIASEMLSVFNADWGNALTGKTDTPKLSDPNLVWSPNDSEGKLSGLIDTAKKTVVATVENLGDPEIQGAFIKAAGRGCKVRLIVPEVNEGPNHNYDQFKSLKSGGVDVRVMPYPASASKPYMHSKMILVDDHEVYTGSVNFSVNSTQKARELGIILSRPEVVSQIGSTFEADWKVSIPPPAKEPTPNATTKSLAMAAAADTGD
jgi:phosphatidylserine/phosphatidylglycerophosphate/cardiolipin synthase-like enzyme